MAVNNDLSKWWLYLSLSNLLQCQGDSSQTRRAKLILSEIKNLRRWDKSQKPIHTTEVQSEEPDTCSQFSQSDPTGMCAVFSSAGEKQFLCWSSVFMQKYMATLV